MLLLGIYSGDPTFSCCTTNHSTSHWHKATILLRSWFHVLGIQAETEGMSCLSSMQTGAPVGGAGMAIGSWDAARWEPHGCGFLVVNCVPRLLSMLHLLGLEHPRRLLHSFTKVTALFSWLFRLPVPHSEVKSGILREYWSALIPERVGRLRSNHSGCSEGLRWCGGEPVEERVEWVMPEACPCPISRNWELSSHHGTWRSGRGWLWSILWDGRQSNGIRLKMDVSLRSLTCPWWRDTAGNCII